MLAFIHALLRFFGLGSPAKKQPAPSAAAGSRSPVWDNWLRQAQALHDTPPDTGPLPADQAVLILERAAYPRATVGQFSDDLVQRARAAFSAEVLEYLRVHAILGLRFPKAWLGETPEKFGSRLAEMARTDVPTWLAGLFSQNPVTIPAGIADVLIQAAADALGQEAPYVVPFGGDPEFVAYAETQSHVVQKETDYCVFPQVIVRGENAVVEVPNSTKRFHRETVRLSGWEFRTRFLGPLNETPDNQDEEGDAKPLLVVRRVLREQFVIQHRRLLAIVRDDEVCRRLMTVPGVGETAS